MKNRFEQELERRQTSWERERLTALADAASRAPRRRDNTEEYVTPELPLSKRFEGMWVVGSQGSGKTQFFKRQAKLDLDMVAAGKASMFILDPTGDQPEVRDDDGELTESATLIHTITRLKRFAKGGDLHGKLVYINPEDRDWFIPINLFAVRADADDEDAVDSVVDSYISVINGLLGQTLTPFQEPVLRYAILATMAFPNPSLSILREVLTVYVPASKNYSPPTPAYEKVIHKLHPDVQAYFRSTWESTRESRNAVLARLSNLTTSGKFRRIFGGARMGINLNQLINEPRVIVINADRQYLGALKELYGRFFLSLLKRAGEARPVGSIPCFAYVDECDEFIRDDQYAGDIIFKLRRKRVGLMLGNQSTSNEQIKNDKTRRALFATAIKLISVNETDSARELAEALNLRSDSGKYDTDALMGKNAFDFAYYCRGVTDHLLRFRFQPGVLESELAMTEAEWQEAYANIRRKYYEPVTRGEPSEPLRPEEPALPITEAALPPTPPEDEDPSPPDDNTPRTRRQFGGVIS